ncbi:hypothetical protein [Candidatus Phytoplasma australiense]|nr:hypothetical protein [Candidatus Phytoplasma australiense]
MVQQNIYNKNKILRHIVLASFLSYMPVALSYLIKEIGVPGFLIPYFRYFIFFPLIVMSFYVPKMMAFVGGFLSEMFIFYLKTKRTHYNPLESLFCALCFVLIPSLFLKKKDNFCKFYFVILLASSLFQIVSWYNILKYRYKLDLLDIQKFDQIIHILKIDLGIRLIVIVPIISLILALILKKLLPRLEFFDNI